MHRKELAVLAVVGALVLWGGAATAVQAPATQATADATDGVTALQEDDDVGENETVDENDTAGDDDADANETTDAGDSADGVNDTAGADDTAQTDDEDAGVNETDEADDAQTDDEDADADANETAEADDTAQADGEDANETAETAEGEFAISNVEALAYMPSNESFEVSANITNTGDEEHSEEVAYRLEGGGVDVVMHENVTLDAGETENVSFEVDENLSEDDYIHGITTYNSSEFTELTVSDDALVNFEDQEADGNDVTVEYTYVPEGGYVAIHETTDDGEVGDVIGVSEYHESGWHNDVNVTLYEDVEGAEFNESDLGENTTLVAMPHQETTDDETFDYVASDGEDDGAYVTDGEPVTDDANVSGVEGVEGAPVDEEEENETTTEEPATDNETTTADDDEADVGPTPISDDEDNETDEPTAPDNDTTDNATDDGMADNETDGEPVAPGNDTADNETDGEPVAPGNDTADNETDGEPVAPGDDNASDDGMTDNETDGEPVAPGDDNESDDASTDDDSSGVDSGLIGSPVSDDGDAGAGNETGGNETAGDDNTTDTGTEDNTTDTGTEDNTTDTSTEDNTTETGDTTDGNVTDDTTGGNATDDTMTTSAPGNETTDNETTTGA